MKKILLGFLSFICSVCAFAQEVTERMSIDDVIDACFAMQDALEKNDTIALIKAAESLRETKTSAFTSLCCQDDSITSLDGHFVFNYIFVDSLAMGANPYEQADTINNTAIYKGQMTGGKKYTKSCMVKAGKSTKYTFTSKGRQELGVVAEPGGLFSVRIHVTNRESLDKWFVDKQNPLGTRRYRNAFDLPRDKSNTVELEVINKCGKDISFVVVSN